MDSMRLIEDYSLLPFMTPRQYYYPRVVLQFYHSMTSRGAAGLLELQFSIDDHPRVLRAADISVALGLRIPPANSEGYRDCAHPTQREMVRLLARDTTAGWASTFQEAAPALDAADRPFIEDQLIPAVALYTAEGSHLRGSLQDLRGILVQPL